MTNRALLSRKTETAAPAAQARTGASEGLRIGAPDDSFEREAERVAEEVMASSLARPAWSLSRVNIGTPLQRECSCGKSAGTGGECEECKKKEALQRQTAGPVTSSPVPTVVHQVLRSPGQPLDAPVRAFFEPRFGHDFRKVRVHTGPSAAESARLVDALAYTVGEHVVFGNGRYAPHTEAGQRLLAHELAHTVQQSPGGATVRRQPGGKAPESAQDKLEKDVREAAAQAGQKIQKLPRRKWRDRVRTLPQRRRVPDAPKPPATPHAPPENLRPDPLDEENVPDITTTPDKPAAQDVSDAKKPDPGSAENQLAVGGVAQSGPAQAGGAVQAAFQDKNYVPGVAYDFCKYFHAQLGVLQPTYTVQLAHIAPIKPGASSAANPSPPPDTAQFSATISPAVLKIGDDLTIAPQIGVAGAVAGDVVGTTKGPGKSGGHTQALAVVNLQVDYKFSDDFSVTGSVGYTQRGVDSGPQGNKETDSLTGSVFATFHFH